MMPDGERKGRVWLVPVMLGLGALWAGVVVVVVARWEEKAVAEVSRQEARLVVFRREPLPPRVEVPGGANFLPVVRQANVLDAETEVLSMSLLYGWTDSGFRFGRNQWLADFRGQAKAFTEIADALEQEDWPSGNSGNVQKAMKVIFAVAFYEGNTGKTGRALERLLAAQTKLLALARSRSSSDLDVAMEGFESTRGCWLAIIQSIASPATAAELRTGAAALLERTAATWTTREQVESMQGQFDYRAGFVGWPLRSLALLEGAAIQNGLATFLENGIEMTPPPAGVWWKDQWRIQPSGSGYGWGLERTFNEREKRFTAAHMAANLYRGETGAFPSSLSVLQNDPVAKFALGPAKGQAMPVELFNDGVQWFFFQPMPMDKPLVMFSGAATRPSYSPRDWRRIRLVETLPPSAQPAVPNQAVKPN